MLSKRMCIQPQRLSCLLIGAQANNNLHLFKQPWLDCPPTAGFVLRNVRLWSLKSFDGYSMISPGCGDHQIHRSHKMGCEGAMCVDGERTFLCHSQTGNLCDIHILSNHAFSYEEFKVPLCAITWSTSLCCFTTERFLGLSPNTLKRIIVYTVADTL